MIPLFNFFGPELLILFLAFLAITVPVIIIVLIARYFKNKKNPHLDRREHEVDELKGKGGKPA